MTPQVRGGDACSVCGTLALGYAGDEYTPAYSIAPGWKAEGKGKRRRVWCPKCATLPAVGEAK